MRPLYYSMCYVWESIHILLDVCFVCVFVCGRLLCICVASFSCSREIYHRTQVKRRSKVHTVHVCIIDHVRAIDSDVLHADHTTLLVHTPRLYVLSSRHTIVYTRICIRVLPMLERLNVFMYTNMLIGRTLCTRGLAEKRDARTRQIFAHIFTRKCASTIQTYYGFFATFRNFS